MRRTILFLILAILLVSACSKKDDSSAMLTDTQPQCATDRDCTAPKTCETVECFGGRCAYEMEDNCCGNGICEESAGEDRCSCEADCNAGCEGEVDFKTNDGRAMKSKYFHYDCIKDKCGIVYDPGRIDPRQAYHDVSRDNIFVGLMLNYIEPFVVGQGKMSIELKLKDMKTDLIKYPISIAEIRVMEDTVLLGRLADPKAKFTQVGDTVTLEIPVIYSMNLPEELKWVTVQVDFSYMSLRRFNQVDESGRPVRDEYGDPLYVYKDSGLKSTQISQRLSKQIYFIDPNYDRTKVDFSQ